MNNALRYKEFLKSKGKPLSEVNEGSEEFALGIDDVLVAIDLLKTVQQLLFGGEVMTSKEGKLEYAYQAWGSQYHTLNWHCQRLKDEPGDDYMRRSYDLGDAAISKARDTSITFTADCYIVLSTWPFAIW